MSVWREVGERVFVRRYEVFDQSIGAVEGDDGYLVVDTRVSHRQGREILRDLHELGGGPARLVVNTHHHSDHAFGNHAFRPATIWGHIRCAERLRRDGRAKVEALIHDSPEMDGEFREVVIDPPDRTFDDRTTVDAGGREVELRYLGRGHTDNDIVVIVPGADVLFAGDLLENGATPYFRDAYPIEWPVTAEALAGLVTGAVVPGHGEPADRHWAARQAADLRLMSELAAAVHAGQLSVEAAIDRSPFPADDSREPLERALAQLRGELG